MKEAGIILEKVRKETPMVHHITNWVVTNFTANITLALGASPIMAHASEEVEEIAAIAGSVVLNIGTLTPPLVEAMILAGKKANESDVPVVLDPVGVGASQLRTQSVRKILQEVKVDILRGNMSEMAIVAGEDVKIRGVDATAEDVDGGRIAVQLADKIDSTVCITGAVDYISDGKMLYKIGNGHPFLTQVTGTGCAATGVVAAFAAMEKDMPLAAASALAFFGLAAEKAAEGAEGPGIFAARLLDSLYNITPQDLEEGARIETEDLRGKNERKT